MYWLTDSDGVIISVPVFISCTLITSNEETKGPLDVLLDVLASSPFTDLLKTTLTQLGFSQEDIANAKGISNT